MGRLGGLERGLQLCNAQVPRPLLFRLVQKPSLERILRQLLLTVLLHCMLNLSLEREHTFICLLDLGVQSLVLIPHEPQVGKERRNLLLVYALCLCQLRLFLSQGIRKSERLSVEPLDVIAPLLLALGSPFCLHLKPLFLHFNAGELLTQLVQLEIDLVLAQVLCLDLVSLSLNQHLLFNFKLLRAIRQQRDFVLSFCDVGVGVTNLSLQLDHL